MVACARGDGAIATQERIGGIDGLMEQDMIEDE
jgi:hypothetical protein